PARLLDDVGGRPDDQEKTARQKKARRGRADGPGAVGNAGPVGSHSPEEKAEDRQRHEIAGPRVRSPRLRPDELHRAGSAESWSARPDGRARRAFGVKSSKPASEAFAESGHAVRSPGVNARIVFERSRD